jgi:dGTP triphosphohydrolase
LPLRRAEDADPELNNKFTSAAIELQFKTVDENIAKHITAVDDSITKRITECDLNWERRITNSELRQSNLTVESEQRQEKRVGNIEHAAGELVHWCQESEGVVNNLKLKVDKLTKYWDRSFLDNNFALTGLITSLPLVSEQTAAHSLPASRLLGPMGTTSN